MAMQARTAWWRARAARRAAAWSAEGCGEVGEVGGGKGVERQGAVQAATANHGHAYALRGWGGHKSRVGRTHIPPPHVDRTAPPGSAPGSPRSATDAPKTGVELTALP